MLIDVLEEHVATFEQFCLLGYDAVVHCMLIDVSEEHVATFEQFCPLGYNAVQSVAC
jgi:hypothetical protein